MELWLSRSYASEYVSLFGFSRTLFLELQQVNSVLIFPFFVVVEILNNQDPLRRDNGCWAMRADSLQPFLTPAIGVLRKTFGNL